MKKLFLFAVTLFAAQFSQAQWEYDVNLSETPDTSRLSTNTSHCIAASGDTVHVVWYDKSEGNWEVYYKRSTDGGFDWEPNTRIIESEAISAMPCISLSGPNLHLVWQDYRDGDRSEIYYQRSIDGGESWEGETRLTEDLTISSMPVVASSGLYVHVVWLNTDGYNYFQIMHKRSSDGGITWDSENLLTYSGMAYYPSIAVSGSDVFVVWRDLRDGDLGEIYFKKSTDNGLTWGPDIRLTYDFGWSNFPCLAISGSSVHVAWSDARDGNIEIYYKGSADGGENWGNDTRLTFDGGSSIYPNLAVSNSVIHIVWQEYRGGAYEIYYNSSIDEGETWEQETQLNDFSFSSEHPFIAVSDPVLHLIWVDYRDFNYEIYYKQNPTGGVSTGIPTMETQNCIYPNPVSKQLLNIKLPLENNACIDVTLYTMTGEIILRQSINGIIENNVLNLKLPNVSAGLYFLQVNYANQVLNKKIVVE